MATAGNSLSSSSSPSTPAPFSTPNANPNPTSSNYSNPMQALWESISRARSRILSLSSLLSLPSLSSLVDSDRPASSLLASTDAYSSISAAAAGSGDDPLCRWLYETFQSSDADLRLVVLSFVPLISGVYLSRLISSPYSSSLAGFESVLLTIYQSETRSRGGRPVSISVPDLSQPSLYHTPRPNPRSQHTPKAAVLSPPLEPQTAVKSTKRACIVAAALDCYFKKVSLMPVRSKLDFCEFVVSWAGQDCSCRCELDDECNLSNFEDDGEIGGFGDGTCGGSRGCRVPMPWELMQPVLRILGHCLLAPRNVPAVRDAASAAVRSVYARASHDLMPQAILASRSLIELDKCTRMDTVAAVAVGGLASNPTTPCKPKKPEVLLVSK